jgi:hypothetical protein
MGIGGIINSIAAPELAIVSDASKVTDSFKQIGAAMQDFVSKSNPGAMVQYNQAVDNLNASLGKMFEPFLSSFIPWIDGLNNVFTKLGNQLSPVTDALGELQAALGEVFSEIGDALVESFKAAKPYIDDITKAIKEMTQWCYYAAEGIRQLIGNTGGKDAGKEKSVAVTQSSFSGIQDIGKQFALAALNQGGGKSTTQQMADDIHFIKEQVANFFKGKDPGDVHAQDAADVAQAALDVLDPRKWADIDFGWPWN